MHVDYMSTICWLCDLKSIFCNILQQNFTRQKHLSALFWTSDQIFSYLKNWGTRRVPGWLGIPVCLVGHALTQGTRLQTTAGMMLDEMELILWSSTAMHWCNCVTVLLLCNFISYGHLTIFEKVIWVLSWALAGYQTGTQITGIEMGTRVRGPTTILDSKYNLPCDII